MLHALPTLALLLLAAPVPAQGPDLAWRARFGRGGASHDTPLQLASGPDGLFVLATSSSSGTQEDFTLLKYTHRGALAWARHFDGRTHGSDRPSWVVADAEGGAVVCGHTHEGATRQVALLHYDPAGGLSWSRTMTSPLPIDFERGPRMARTAEGELRVGWTAGGNFVVAAFDAQGTPLWRRELDVAPGALDVLTALAVDSEGNTLVGGPVGEGFGGYETLKLDPDGDLLWRDTELGDFGSTLGPVFLAIDGEDEVVLTGVPESTCGLPQARTWRLAPDGTRLWTRSFPSDPCDTAVTVDMAVDAEGGVVVLSQATFSQVDGWHAIHTLKYDREGNERWRKLIAYPSVDFPVALELDRAGNAYVTGTLGLAAHAVAGMMVSYASDGTQRWMRIFDAGERIDWPADLALGPRGELYLGAALYERDGTADVLTVRLEQP